VVDLDGLLEQAVEEEAATAGVAAVEPEGEFVEVEVELESQRGEPGRPHKRQRDVALWVC